MNQKKKYFFIITFLINLVLIVFLLLLLERHLKITDLKLREETLKKETHRRQNIYRDLIKYNAITLVITANIYNNAVAFFLEIPDKTIK